MSNQENGSDLPATSEPQLTDQNSRTVRGEEILADGGTVESNETNTRSKSVAIPSSYGAAGGTTDATEEGGDGTGI